MNKRFKIKNRIGNQCSTKKKNSPRKCHEINMSYKFYNKHNNSALCCFGKGEKWYMCYVCAEKVRIGEHTHEV